ncbi:hypothetical protein ABZ897_41275 [Nonomuraea sp. NPDC046802]|uniref:hypothetical protein n=1 Tax=Nonomuraea sp. NPDC046802 TaxID=3154919 RepID=UPI0033F4B76D
MREVVFAAVRGGEQTLRELAHEFKIKGPVYRRTVQTTLKASYTNHSLGACGMYPDSRSVVSWCRSPPAKGWGAH